MEKYISLMTINKKHDLKLNPYDIQIDLIKFQSFVSIIHTE